MVDKISGLSADIRQANFEQLAQLFPSCVIEVPAAVADADGDGTGDAASGYKKVFDFARLAELIGQDAVVGAGAGSGSGAGAGAVPTLKGSSIEPYGFSWAGKRQAQFDANSIIDKTLRPCVAESVDFEHTHNLFIEGDNLEALKLLLRGYSGSVKMIYIDPPYNTGSDLIYRDEFRQSKQDYEQAAGLVDDEGMRFVLNSNADARFHSNWCSMIYARLCVARHLLRRDGVIFISIDDNEQPRLRSICDEIFGEQNFVAQMIWSAGRKNDSKFVSVSHEYILVYMRDKAHAIATNSVWRERKQGIDAIYACYDKLKRQHGSDCAAIERGLRAWFKSLSPSDPARGNRQYNHVDNKGIFFPSDISFPGGGGPRYELLHPITHKPVKIPSRGFFTSKERMLELIAQDKIYFGADENRVPKVKTYLRENELSVPYSVFYQDGRAASKRLDKLLGSRVFENPKDATILQRLMEFCGTKDDDIILDFFSGSASTAEAVLRANAADGGQRRFILVQYPEVCAPKSNAAKVGFATICDIGKARLRLLEQEILSGDTAVDEDDDIDDERSDDVVPAKAKAKAKTKSKTAAKTAKTVKTAQVAQAAESAPATAAPAVNAASTPDSCTKIVRGGVSPFFLTLNKILMRFCGGWMMLKLARNQTLMHKMGAKITTLRMGPRIQ